MLAEKLREIIAQKIEEQKRTISSVEKIAGLPQNAVRNIVEGRSQNPTITTLHAIARALNCSLDELIGNLSSSNVAGFNSNKADKHLDSIEWNPDLFHKITEAIIAYIKEINLQPKLPQILFFIEESYVYSVTKKNNEFDPQFIEWLIEHNLKNN
ncbi:helix-turn-helix domain-containing protein [Candidatus Jidaibacter acanthamoebae]|nr:helix-turn-helix transcriptional regulator [Candidatus Jidaibacter acanthamoeba]